MSFHKILFVTIVVLFSTIVIVAVGKKFFKTKDDFVFTTPIELEEQVVDDKQPGLVIEEKEEEEEAVPVFDKSIDLVNKFFNKGDDKFPIVETIVYQSRVPWLNGRSAWVSNYSQHYQTSQGFIARSLTGKETYSVPTVYDGDRFNVFKKDRDISFHLSVNITNCKMDFYYLDEDEKVFVKTYDIGLGRIDETKESGYLTPLGKFSLGNKIDIHTPNKIGRFKGEKVKAITVFGSRWIPFDKEIENCTAPARSFGIHGMPCEIDSDIGEIREIADSLGKYESDGCIRMLNKDIKELYSIITIKSSIRPTTIEITK